MIGKHLESYHEDNLNYLQVEIYSSEKENIRIHFDSCNKFIAEAETGNVFIHCAAGKHRSPSIVIAALIFLKKMTF